MKVTIEIDCSPEEARAFMGLPDVQPMQAAIMASLEKQAKQAVEHLSPDAMLKQWFNTLPMLSNQVQDMFSRLINNGAGKN